MKSNYCNSIFLVLTLISSIVQCGCLYSYKKELSTRKEKKKWSENYCCNDSNKTNCSFSNEESFEYTYTTSASIGISFFNSVSAQVGESVTQGKSFKKTFNYDVVPGTCKYVDVTVEKAKLQVLGFCSYWYTFGMYMPEYAILEYTKDVATFDMIEIPNNKNPGSIGKVVDSGKVNSSKAS
ncbi:hypothetical protein BB559_000068 [Furculomyces boomerangus]|uniref:Lipoprotein n=2 Tax=Harpellales TaxID=61421 RepID=A0A2T9Z6E8_9FUNG|nr:hypothetical protein BB559_000068 [Furculomyces boomerangus]PVZ98952.1 hypothetical protein BB558_005044 [Smittium angustum]